jgi:hypothetical protein
MRIAARGGLYLAIAFLLPLAIMVGGGLALVSIYIELANTEMADRNDQELQLTEKPQSGGPIIQLILHRLVPEENAVEASLAIQWYYGDLTPAYAKREKCMTVVLDDRTKSGTGPVITQSLDCKQVNYSTSAASSAYQTLYAESNKFHLHIFGSVNAFPFDELYLLVSFTVLMNPTSITRDYPIAYVLDREFPGRTAYLRVAYPNVEVGLKRSFDEKAFVLGSTAVFMLLTLIVSIKLCAKDARLTGLQEVFAVAGYLVAVNSFRDLTGMSRTTGRSALEVAVFGLALAAPAVGIVLSAWRSFQPVARPPDES